VARPTSVAISAAPTGPGGGMGGRSQAAKSEAGQPGQGAVIISEIAARAAAAEGMAGRGRGSPPGGFGFGRTISLLDAIAGDGTFHSMYVSNGEEPAPPIPFVPAGSNVHGLIVLDNVAYAATSKSCGGAPNAVWALDLNSKKVAQWTAGGDIAGAAAVAFGPDGTAYVATDRGELTALDPKTLQAKAAYKTDRGFVTSPVVFEYKGKTLVAAATSDGRIHLVDGASLAGKAYPGAASGEIASWQDTAGARWILAPSKDVIAAWKVSGDADAPLLSEGWTSREMDSPMPPLVVNEVVFAVANGAQAQVYAFDGVTGKELWNSGKTIAAPARYGSLSASGGQVYIGASDRTIYAFGFPIEH